MKILVISDHETEGGASIAMQRMIAGLKGLQVSVHHLVLIPDNVIGVHSFPVSRCLLPIQWVLVQRMLEKCRLNGLARILLNRFCISKLRKVLNQFQPDVINLHNIHASASGLAVLEALPQEIPVVWTLHDMWTFTGRCAYSGSCRKFVDGCDDSCKTWRQYPALAPSKIEGAWHSKSAWISSRDNVFAVGPSEWICRKAGEGIWGDRVTHIANGIDLDAYFPLPRSAARALLGIGQEDFVMAAAAVNFDEERKGAALLREAVEGLEMPGKLLVLGGSNKSPAVGQVEWIRAGYLRDRLTIVAHLCAADVFVHPALQDNLPNVVVEAAACGVPVVAMPVGGLIEMVVDGCNGWMAEDISSEGLRIALTRAWRERKSWSAYRSRSRDYALDHYSLGGQSEKYLELFMRAANKVVSNSGS